LHDEEAGDEGRVHEGNRERQRGYQSEVHFPSTKIAIE
jgi:hypothetical protein